MMDFGLSLWLHRMEDIVDEVAEIPPARIIMYPDLLEKAWGWQRLFPYKCYMDWSVYKKYLKDYHERNRDEVAALILDNKPDCYIQGIASYGFFRSNAPYDFKVLRAAADMCARREKKLRSRCSRTLTDEDLQLSREISKYAKHVMQSESEEDTTFSFAAAPGFMCIMKEAELMFELLHRQFDFDTTELVSLSSKIRRSAWNLMQYPMPVDEDESTIVSAAAAAMVGVANEAKMVRYLLTRQDADYDLEIVVCDFIRQGAAIVLTKLLKELRAAGGSCYSKFRESRSQYLPRGRGLYGVKT